MLTSVSTGELRVARVHTPHVGTERHLPAMRIVRVVEVVVPLRVGAERGIVLVRRQRQRRAAAPAADQLRGEQFALFLGAVRSSRRNRLKAPTRD